MTSQPVFYSFSFKDFSIHKWYWRRRRSDNVRRKLFCLHSTFLICGQWTKTKKSTKSTILNASNEPKKVICQMNIKFIFIISGESSSSPSSLSLFTDMFAIFFELVVNFGNYCRFDNKVLLIFCEKFFFIWWVTFFFGFFLIILK